MINIKLSILVLAWAVGFGSNSQASEPTTDGVSLESPKVEWGQFRGPEGRGIALEHWPLPTLRELEQELAWKVRVPAGHSSPILVGDRVYLTSFSDGLFRVHCIGLQKGEEIWRREEAVSAVESFHPQHGPSSCTPVSDGHRLYAVFGSIGLICYDLEGKELWRQEWELRPNLFGSAASPILHQGRLIVFSGNEKESRLQMIEPETGQVVWERRRDGAASSWSTPTVWDHELGAQVLFYEPYTLRACDLATGEDLWSIPGLADEPITVPQVVDGMIFTTSYNLRTNSEATGLPTFESLLQECDANQDRLIDKQEARSNLSILSRPDADGQGDHPLRMFFRLLDEDQSGAISEVEWPRIKSWMEPWEHANGILGIKLTGQAPSLAWEQASGVPECPTPICIDGKIYAIRNGGLVTCLEAKTGKQLFQERLAGGGPYYASPVFGDNKLYCASARGELTAIDLTAIDLTRPMSTEGISHLQLKEGIWATPAIGPMVLVVRSEDHLWCFRSQPPIADRDQ